jgi:uncharacterized protein (TIGR03435 family)
MTRLLASLAIIVGLGAALPSAQQASAPPAPSAPSFEVASIKLSDPNATGPLSMIPLMLPQGPGRLSVTNMNLRFMIRAAFGLQDFQIVGGPSWLNQQKFDIVAKAEDTAAADTGQLMPMLKTLIIDRFKLKTHMETRELPIEKLVIARSDGKLGPKITVSNADCTAAREQQQKLAQTLLKGGPAALAGALPRPGETMPCAMMPMIGPDGFGMRGNAQPLTVLVALLTQATGKIVQDRTGLTGLFDFELKFDPEVLLRAASQFGINVPAGANLTPPGSDNPPLLTALREQLGLKLDSDKGPIEVLVIDSAEMPTPD